MIEYINRDNNFYLFLCFFMMLILFTGHVWQALLEKRQIKRRLRRQFTLKMNFKSQEQTQTQEQAQT